MTLHWVFGRPKEAGHHHVSPPRRVLYRLHRGEHILTPRRGNRIKREVHQVIRLVLDTKREVRRLIQDVVSGPVGVRRNRIARGRHSGIKCYRLSQFGSACVVDTCRK